LALVAAVLAACGSSTSPHQPGQCPSYSGGVAGSDSLYGLFRLVSYCLDTLPAYGPPTDTGRVTLSHAASVDSFVAVIASQGQPSESILGTYTHPIPDSIHVTGIIRISGLSLAVELRGRFLLRSDTLSVSGRLAATGAGERPLSFVGARVP
jgi:hypothetical protein